MFRVSASFSPDTSAEGASIIPVFTADGAGGLTTFLPLMAFACVFTVFFFFFFFVFLSVRSSPPRLLLRLLPDLLESTDEGLDSLLEYP